MLLSCGEETEEYSFGFHVFSPDLSVKEQIETALEKQNQKNKTKRILFFRKNSEKKKFNGKNRIRIQ